MPSKYSSAKATTLRRNRKLQEQIGVPVIQNSNLRVIELPGQGALWVKAVNGAIVIDTETHQAAHGRPRAILTSERVDKLIEELREAQLDAAEQPGYGEGT